MAAEYEIARYSGKCAATQRDLEQGESYYVVLSETDEGFQRIDLSLEAWDGPPEGSFCHWRARVPIKSDKKGHIHIDHALLATLFQRLENEDSPIKQQFRFVLALLLMRKRLLRLERTEQDGDLEYWMMRLGGDETQYKVLNPRLTADEVERLSLQLTALLSGEVDPEQAIDGTDLPHPTSEQGETESDDAADGDASGDAEVAVEPEAVVGAEGESGDDQQADDQPADDTSA